jgi:formylglycine-generating enzyme required for sulfatase activity
MWEWVQDGWAQDYPNPCADCAYLDAASGRVIRGGSFNNTATNLLTWMRTKYPQTWRITNVAARCARSVP